MVLLKRGWYLEVLDGDFWWASGLKGGGVESSAFGVKRAE